MDMVTPSGMSYSWSLTRVFILTASHARLDGHGHPLWNVVLLVLDKSLHPHSL